MRFRYSLRELCSGISWAFSPIKASGNSTSVLPKAARWFATLVPFMLPSVP
jgi:hypothetical protein